MTSRALPLLLAGLLAGSGGARAQSDDDREQLRPDTTDTSWRRPLGSRNQFPLALLFVYLRPDRAGVTGPGSTTLELRFDYSNIITEQETDTELLTLDLEYLRTDVTLSRGFSGGFELGLSMPFYVYYGGFLDPFVSAFHEAFGLPNFLRGRTDNGLTRFDFQRGANTVFKGNEAFSALGDVSIHLKKSLVARAPYGFAVRSSLKLPTGDPETLSGSGGTDLGLGVAFDRVGERFGLFVNASYHVLGEPDRFPVRNFFSVMAGFDYRFKPRLAMVIQADHLRPFVEGELPIFNKGGQQVALGLRFRHSERFVYEWRVVEDLSDVAPDFTVAFDVAIRWTSDADAR